MIIFASTSGSGAMGDPIRPAFADVYPGLSYALSLGGAGRSAYAVANPSAAMLADYRFPAAADTSFASYQSGLLTAMDQWLAPKVAVGITVGATVLDATPAGRDWLTFQATALLAGLNGGSITGASTVTVYDTQDAAHTLTVTAALAAFWSYSTQYAALLSTYRGKRNAVRTATTAAQLDAVAIPA